MNMTKKAKTILLGIILWFVGIALLTPVVLRASHRVASETDIDNSGLANPVVYAIDRVLLSQNIFSDVSISGWAFVENVGKSADKTISAIFESEGESYRIEMKTFKRFDLDTAPILEGYAIPKSLNGFEGSFSPLGMKNGTYKLYLYVKENQNLEGMVNTGRVFVKRFGTFEEYLGGESVSSPNTDFDSKITVHAYFTCDPADGNVMVRGWAFMEDGVSKKVPSQPIVSLKKSDGTTAYFSTTSHGTIDVAQEFEAKDLDRSGFSSEIPIAAFGKGDNTISIIYEGLGQSTFTCTVSR